MSDEAAVLNESNDSLNSQVDENHEDTPLDFSSLRTTLEGKKRIVQQYLEEGLPIRTFCANHKIPPATLSRWKKQYIQSTKGGADTLYARAGRPTKIDEDGQHEIIQALKEHLQAKKHVRKRDLRSICEAAVLQTAKRRNVAMSYVELSAKTVKKYVLVARSLLTVVDGDGHNDDEEERKVASISHDDEGSSEDVGHTSTDETGDSNSISASTEASVPET